MKDRNAIAYKNKTMISKVFIKEISTSKEDLSLEYVAIMVLRLGLSRDRKTELNEVFKPFSNFITQFKVIKEVEAAISFSREYEKKIAKDFVSGIRY